MSKFCKTFSALVFAGMTTLVNGGSAAALSPGCEKLLEVPRHAGMPKWSESSEGNVVFVGPSNSHLAKQGGASAVTVNGVRYSVESMAGAEAEIKFIDAVTGSDTYGSISEITEDVSGFWHVRVSSPSGMRELSFEEVRSIMPDSEGHAPLTVDDLAVVAAMPFQWRPRREFRFRASPVPLPLEYLRVVSVSDLTPEYRKIYDAIASRVEEFSKEMNAIVRSSELPLPLRHLLDGDAMAPLVTEAFELIGNPDHLRQWLQNHVQTIAGIAIDTPSLARRALRAGQPASPALQLKALFHQLRHLGFRRLIRVAPEMGILDLSDILHFLAEGCLPIDDAIDDAFYGTHGRLTHLMQIAMLGFFLDARHGQGTTLKLMQFIGNHPRGADIWNALFDSLSGGTLHHPESFFGVLNDVFGPGL